MATKAASGAGSWQPYLLAALTTACSALPLFHSVGALELIACAGVAIGSGWTLLRAKASPAVASSAHSNARHDDAANHFTGEGDDDLKRLLASVLPVWLHHVGSAKDQTEEAITKLAISFSSINKQFAAAGFVGASGSIDASKSTTFSLLTLCERQLRPVVTTMTGILEGKQSLVNSVNDLAGATKELATMASDVSLIAAHTNILAINAAIEAAHAGDSGRGFAVIAKEIRALSQTSAEAGKRIAVRMEQVEKIMSEAVEAAEQASENDRAAIELSGSVIQDVLAHVRELGSNAEAMREQGNIIRTDTERLLVNLQFQDRVSQIMAVIDNDISRLQRTVETPDGVVPSPQQWLADLNDQYTMDDQRITGDSAGGGHQASNEPAEEVMFF